MSAAHLVDWSMAIHWKVKHRTKKKEKQKAFPTIKLHQNRNPHDSWFWEAAYSFLVFWCWRQRKGSGSFWSTSSFTSNWTVWLSLGKKSSISVHGTSKLVLIYQPDSSAAKPAKDISDQPPSLLSPFLANGWANQKWIHLCGWTLN